MSKIITAIVLTSIIADIEALKTQTETRFGHLPKWAKCYKVCDLVHYNVCNDMEIEFLSMEVCKMDFRKNNPARLVRDYNCALFFRLGLKNIQQKYDL